MKKTITMILVNLLYLFPFVYFSMYQDYSNGLVIGYLVMILVTCLLVGFNVFFGKSFLILLGNIVTFIVSFYFVYKMNETGIGRWDGYFKPFGPTNVLILVSILNVIPQVITFILVKYYKKQKNNEEK